MKKDFDNIGKRMPYKTPEGFFDRIAEQTLAEAERREGLKKTRTFPKTTIFAMAASISLLIVLSYFLVFHRQADEKPWAPEKIIVIASVAKEEKPETVKPVAEEVPAAQKSTAKPAAKVPEKQSLAKVKNPETVAEVLASFSDEEIQLLAALADTDLQVYEQTN